MVMYVGPSIPSRFIFERCVVAYDVPPRCLRYKMRLRLAVVSVGLSVYPSVPCEFQKTKIENSESGKSLDDMIFNSDNSHVSSF